MFLYFLVALFCSKYLWLRHCKHSLSSLFIFLAEKRLRLLYIFIQFQVNVIVCIMYFIHRFYHGFVNFLFIWNYKRSLNGFHLGNCLSLIVCFLENARFKMRALICYWTTNYYIPRWTLLLSRNFNFLSLYVDRARIIVIC